VHDDVHGTVGTFDLLLIASLSLCAATLRNFSRLASNVGFVDGMELGGVRGGLGVI